MIKDKNRLPVNNTTFENKDEPEIIEENALTEMYYAIKRAILTIKENPNKPDSEPFFKTIQIDRGQFQRIILEKNMEGEIFFPAIFIHFTNVRYLVQHQRIGQGRATLRIRFILNYLNPQHENFECQPYFIFQRINVAIQKAKEHEASLSERCNLLYFDEPTTHSTLQAFWVDYEVWFKDMSTFLYRDWQKRYIVMPPFTNHSDSNIVNDHKDHEEPTYDEVSGFSKQVDNIFE